MNAKTITNLFNEVASQNVGAHQIKFDLHIHTLGSSDYKKISNLNEEEQYISILQEAYENELEIIAITDHNTFRGYNRLKEIISNNYERTKQYKKILILCGIEITCYSNHILAIFDKNFSRESQDVFLHEIGIDKSLEGTENAMADELGPSALLKKINDYGGITILAHADSKKGFLYSFCRESGTSKSEIPFSGKSLSKIIKSPFLYGIQVVSEYGESKINQLLLNKDYQREDRALSILHFSDSHGLVLNGIYTGKSGKKIGASYSVAKLSYKSFNAIKMALTDPDIRIIPEKYNEVNYPIIIGCSIKSEIIKNENKEYVSFKFNSELNCIIGARGTGKSTLLTVIQNVIRDNQFFELTEPESDRDEFSLFHKAVVFINYNNNIYAIYYDNYQKERKVYILYGNNFKFCAYEPVFLNIFLTKGYQQRELYLYSRYSSKTIDIIDDFIIWKNYNRYGELIGIINQNKNKFSSEFKNFKRYPTKKVMEYINDEDLKTNYLNEYEAILKANLDIYDLRDSLVNDLNHILQGKIKLTLFNELKYGEYEYITESIPERIKNKTKQNYEYQVHLKNFLKSIVEKAKIRFRLDFFKLLVQEQNSIIIDEYKLANNKTTNIFLNDLRKYMDVTELMLFLTNGLKLEYNVNTGIKNTSPIYRTNNHLSLGQNAVALLLIILSASQELDDNRPLIIDQPEDDLDNSYIYNTLVDEFRKAKSKRQLIISTHNANIPVSADAENILVLHYNGQFGYLYKNGSLDSPDISRSVLDVLEGGELALQSRNDKYRNIIKIIK